MEEESDEDDDENEDEDEEDTNKQSHSSKQNDDADAKAVISKAKVEDDEYKTDEQTYYRLIIFFSFISKSQKKYALKYSVMRKQTLNFSSFFKQTFFNRNLTLIFYR